MWVQYVTLCGVASDATCNKLVWFAASSQLVPHSHGIELQAGHMLGCPLTKQLAPFNMNVCAMC